MQILIIEKSHLYKDTNTLHNTICIKLTLHSRGTPPVSKVDWIAHPVEAHKCLAADAMLPDRSYARNTFLERDKNRNFLRSSYFTHIIIVQYMFDLRYSIND